MSFVLDWGMERENRGGFRPSMSPVMARRMSNQWLTLDGVAERRTSHKDKNPIINLPSSDVNKEKAPETPKLVSEPAPIETPK
jgi:hypothetical protein